jgi:dTDP-4-amino-4,6-dideoxygalactose transaminase
MSAASALSFFPSKNLGAFGDGGMVVSPDAKLVERVKRLRVHGSSKLYLHDEIGYNSRLDSLQAAVLRVKLRKLDQWLEARRKVAARYNDEFSKMGIVTPEPAEYNVHTYHQYTIRVDKRDELLKYLNDNGVSSRVYYPVPLHLQPCYKDLGYFKGDLPVSEEMSDKVLSLPVYPELSEEAVGYIINTVKRFVG